MEDPVRRWLPVTIFAACIGLATPAAAQFTAVVPPPRAVQPNAEATRRGQSEGADTTAAAARLSDLRAWVDSAVSSGDARPADVPPVRDSAADTAQVAMAERASAPATRTETVEFRNGALAPDTASPLPLLALLGAASILLGITVRKW